MNPALNIAYWLQRRLWRLFRPNTHGVKVMLFNASGQLVLIRNNYGRSDLFVLPGGGIKRREEPVQAARREIKEELGFEVENLAFLSRHSSGSEGKRDTIDLFTARVDGEPSTQVFEVREAGFFALDGLPASTSPATRRRIEEFLEKRSADGSW